MVVGTIVNGHVRLDAPSELPDGTRVRLVADEDWDEVPSATHRETREEFLAGLRESIADPEAVEARRFMKELAVKHGLPLMPGE
jgi:hypothetical protein